MPSVMGLLEERERGARQRVEVLQAQLREAEAARERLVIARETVGQVWENRPETERPRSRRPRPGSTRCPGSRAQGATKRRVEQVTACGSWR